jgi:hypothetical protein
MPDNYWFQRLATRLGVVFATLVALALIGWGVIYGLSQEAAYEQSARDAHFENSKYACYEIAKTKRKANPVKQRNSQPCAPSKEGQDENANRRDYADLVAQRSSALWAKIMGIAALVGMGLSLLGVVLVAITFRETRKANEIASGSQRAWIDIEPKISINAADPDNIAISAISQFTNVGKTVAKNVSLNVSFVTRKPGKVIADYNEMVIKMLRDKNKGALNFMPGTKISRGQKFGGYNRQRVQWNENGIAVFAVIAVAAYDIEGSELRRYTSTIFTLRLDGDNALGGMLGIKWEDLASPYLIVDPDFLIRCR